MQKIWDMLIRWRTWLINAVTAIIVALPFILNMPELQAVLPPDALPWVLLVNALLNVWMRPRPAVRARDPEADVTRLRKTYGGDHPTGIGA